MVVFLGDFPELREEFGLVGAGNEFHGRIVVVHFLKIVGDEQGLAALRFGVEHGDADDLRGERPERHEARDLLALGFLGDGVANLLGLAEKIFLLRLVEVFEWLRGGFDVENESCHAGRLTAKTPRTPS